MGVITRLRPMDDIVEDLDPREAIAVISCNNCVKVCGSGGEGAWEPFCEELAKRGFRIEDRFLITNPCSRAYLENLSLSPTVKACVMMACDGAMKGFQTAYPDVKLVPASDTLGLFVVSKADGVVKLVIPFSGYEDLAGREFKFGDGQTMLKGEKLAVSHGG